MASVDRWVWVHGNLLVDVSGIIEHSDGATQGVTSKGHYVRQSPGRGLGYEIVEWSEETLPGRTPTFEAFKLTLQDESRLRFRLADVGGRKLDWSAREMRTVQVDQPWLMAMSALVPLLFGTTLFFNTRRKAMAARRDPQFPDAETGP